MTMRNAKRGAAFPGTGGAAGCRTLEATLVLPRSRESVFPLPDAEIGGHIRRTTRNCVTGIVHENPSRHGTDGKDSRFQTPESGWRKDWAGPGIWEMRINGMSGSAGALEIS